MRQKLTKSYIVIGSMISLLVIFVVGTYFINSTKNDVIQQDQQYLKEIAKQNSEYVRNMLDGEMQMLARINENLERERRMELNAIMDVLQEEVQATRFEWLGFVNQEGMLHTSEGLTMNVSQQNYYTKAMAGKQYISDRLEDVQYDMYGNVYSLPLMMDDSVHGALVAYKDGTTLAQYLNVQIFDGEGFSYIVKENGEVVVYDSSHKNNFTSFDNLYDEMAKNGSSVESVVSVKESIKEHKNGTFQYVRNDIERLAAFHKVGINDWYIVTVVPEYVISQKSNAIIVRNVIIFGIVSTFLVALIVFIIYQSKKNTKKLETLAFVDEVTQSANFNKFKQESEQILRNHPKQKYVLIKLDFEAFNIFNQIYGYSEGNLVLRGVAKIMAMLLDSKEEIFARVTSDEFVVLKKYEDMDGLDADYATFEHLLNKQVASKYNYEFRIRYGCYVLDEEMRDIYTAYERANIAHRISKTIPDMRICDYDRSLMNARIREKEIENRMEFALKSEQFKVYLQPKYYIESQSLAGAEALVRWQDGLEDVLYPNEFIPIFEKNGFIIKLDMYMFEKVCQLARKWLDSNLEVQPISINFSTLHLKNTNFIQELCAISDLYKVPRKYLEIELTETAMIENAEVLEGFTATLHKAGFALAMDDFGVGYSSLGLLKNISVDVIKLDRSFIWDVKDSARSKIVLANIIMLAKELHIKTVAEGVETHEQKELLRELSCDIVQGYYYSKPLDIETYELKAFKSVVS